VEPETGLGQGSSPQPIDADLRPDPPPEPRAIAFGSERATIDSLPLKRGGMGRGSNTANDPSRPRSLART
jgi:hypothetical protein